METGLAIAKRISGPKASPRENSLVDRNAGVGHKCNFALGGDALDGFVGRAKRHGSRQLLAGVTSYSSNGKGLSLRLQVLGIKNWEVQSQSCAMCVFCFAAHRLGFRTPPQLAPSCWTLRNALRPE